MTLIGRILIRRIAPVALIVGLCATDAPAQSAVAWAWRPLIEHEGVTFQYIFYSEADGKNNGVVLMLTNNNAYPVIYRFKIVFRSDDEEEIRAVSGDLNPGQSKTGEHDGLFWIPFVDGRSISEIGLRGYRVAPKAHRTGPTK